MPVGKGWDHQEYATELRNELKRRGLRAQEGVRVVLPGLATHPAPDVLVVSRDNPDQPGGAPYFGVPDLVVAVLAADNDEGEDLVKRSEYAAAGVRHYWLVRLKGMILEASVLGTDGRYHAASAGPLLPLEALPVPDDLR
jgi:hypothetical protein